MSKEKLKLNPTMAAGAIGNATPYRSISGGTPYIPPVSQKGTVTTSLWNNWNYIWLNTAVWMDDINTK